MTVRRFLNLFGTVPLLLAAILWAALVFAPKTSAAEEDAPIKDFYGAYVGDAVIEGTLQFRDIIVSIEPIRNGFSVYTSTVVRNGPQRATRNVKWRAETQYFEQTDVPHVYQPLVRKSMFSTRKEPNLLGGDTLAWASIQGRTLGIYAMNLLDDGHYELRVFERTLTDLGMNLHFVRYSDGVPVRELHGKLARTKQDKGDEAAN